MVVATDGILLDEVNRRPIAGVAHHSRLPMVLGRLLMKSFAGFRLLVVTRWPPEAFVGADATIFRQEPTTAGTTTE